MGCRRGWRYISLRRILTTYLSTYLPTIDGGAGPRRWVVGQDGIGRSRRTRRNWTGSYGRMELRKPSFYLDGFMDWAWAGQDLG